MTKSSGSRASGLAFIYSGDNETSTIQNFNPSKDVLDFQNTAESFGSVNIYADPNDGHAVVQSDHSVVNIMGVTADQLSSSNVLFNIPS